MLEPNGPLPPEIYWRRRILAAGVILVVIVLVVWIISAVAGGGSDDSPEAAAAADTSELVEPTTTAADAPADDSGSSTSGASDTSASGTSAAAASSGAEVAPCADQSLALKVSPDRPQYRSGDEPSFSIAITNIGTSKCERDLGSGLQQALVYSLNGNNRLWSNVDCYPDPDPAMQVLEPGGQARFTVKWSGTTSEPGCKAPRTPVVPGAYTVVAQLGELRSSPEPFNFS